MCVYHCYCISLLTTVLQLVLWHFPYISSLYLWESRTLSSSVCGGTKSRSGFHMQIYKTDQNKQDNNTTIYLTPVFEEVPPRLESQNVEGEPPDTPGETRRLKFPHVILPKRPITLPVTQLQHVCSLELVNRESEETDVRKRAHTQMDLHRRSCLVCVTD